MLSKEMTVPSVISFKSFITRLAQTKQGEAVTRIVLLLSASINLS